jgi:uncharacterized membrane protein YphA (DoxX/SURF4 family)
MAKTNKLQTVSLLLRLGLAFCFLYAAIFSFKNPQEWVSFVPKFTTGLVSADLSLKLISCIQIVLAVWLLWGKWLRYSALIAFLLLAGIVVFNLNLMVITFRDIGLAFMALALIYLDT